MQGFKKALVVIIAVCVVYFVVSTYVINSFQDPNTIFFFGWFSGLVALGVFWIYDIITKKKNI